MQSLLGLDEGRNQLYYQQRNGIRFIRIVCMTVMQNDHLDSSYHYPVEFPRSPTTTRVVTLRIKCTISKRATRPIRS